MPTPYRLARPPYVSDQNGKALAGAVVTFYVQETGALATIYSDVGLTTVIPGSAITTDANGRFDSYFISDDDYPLTTSFKLTVVKVRYESFQEEYVR